MNTTLLASFGDILGTTWWSILMFVAGAAIGTPLWNWVSKKLPWNK